MNVIEIFKTVLLIGTFLTIGVFFLHYYIQFKDNKHDEFNDDEYYDDFKDDDYTE